MLSFFKKLLNKTANNQQLKSAAAILLFVLILLQPALDTIYLFSEKVIGVFGVSPATVVRFLGVLALFVLTFLCAGLTKKLLLFIIYLLFCLVYFVFHILNAADFVTLVPDLKYFSLLNEAVYLFRLLYPAFLVYAVVSLKPQKHFFKNLIFALSGQISGIIIISNLFCFSLDSYTNEKITHNIFSWFGGVYKTGIYNGLASKGFFNFANATSVVLCMLLPLVIYFSLCSEKPFGFILVFLQSVAMLMLGTKTSAYGVCLTLGASILIFLFFLLFKRKTLANENRLINVICLVIVLCLTLAIFPKSPAVWRSRVAEGFVDKYAPESPLENDDSGKAEENTLEEQAGEPSYALKDWLYDSGIQPVYFERAYPIEYDGEFWQELSSLDTSLRINNRFVQEALLKRVKAVNNNFGDHLFGITYSRTSRIFNLERDFLYQYYSFGAVGTALLMGPYMIMLLYGVFVCLKSFKTRCTLPLVLTILSVAVALGTSFYCGNSLDAIFVNSILGLTLGFLLILTKKDSFN